MQVPPEICFRDMPHSDSVDQHVREKIDKLEQYSSRIVSCHVVLEQVVKGRVQGNRHKVSITVNLPEQVLVANHEDRQNLYKAIRDAFDNITRQLRAYNSKHNGEAMAKVNPLTLQGTIDRLFMDDAFGFICSQDQEYYFNQSHLVHEHFASLEVGDRVHFIEANTHQGVQAHHVIKKKDP